MLILQFGLLIALLRYRLYDADVAISRSANFALITLSVAAIFAAAQDIVKQIVFNYSGDSSSDGPIIFAAALRPCWSTRSRTEFSAGLNAASSTTCSSFATTFRKARATCAKRHLSTS